MSTALQSKPHRLHNIPYWHWLPIVVYFVVNGLVFLFDFDRLLQIRSFLTPIPLVLMSLATYRIANIIANESLTQVVRAPFVNVKQEGGEEVEVPKTEGVRETIGTMIYCPSCVGVWVATGLVYLFLYASPIAWVVCTIFALSAMERVLTGLISWIHKQTD